MNRANEREIASRAYAIWEREGRPDGRSVEHWLAAERELDSGGEAGGRKSTEQNPMLKAENRKTASISVLKPKNRSRG